MKLNLGCGDKKRDGYVNVDRCGAPDVQCDLSRFPWPWADGSVEEVFCEHYLEHVDDYERTVLEVHRILAPAGRFHFRVPHHRSPMAVWHLHKWPFSVYTPLFLCDARPYQWGGRRLFEKEALRINFVYGGSCRRRLLSALANLHPLLWDWLGLPVEEVEFRGRKAGA